MAEEKKTTLEEAAEEYRRESYSKSVLPNIDGPMPEYGGSIKDAFKAGAEWQKQQMIRDCSIQASYEAEIEKAEERGYNLCKEQMMTNEEMKCALRMEYEKGVFDTKQQMLKDAVEGEVCKGDGDVWIELSPNAMPHFKDMQPVKVIVIKED